MKHLKTYREQSDLCNESILNFLKPKSKDRILDAIKKAEEELKNERKEN